MNKLQETIYKLQAEEDRDSIACNAQQLIIELDQ